MLRVLCLTAVLMSAACHAFGSNLGKACSADQECLSDAVNWRCLETPGTGNPCVTDSSPHNTTCTCSPQQCEPLVWKPSTDKPKYLMIGDSISMGYRATVFGALDASYESVHAPGNNGNTNWGNRCINGWMPSPEQFDVVTFNFGLHDLAKDDQHVDVTTYGALLANITSTILAKVRPDTTVMWVSTTPVPTDPAEPLFPVRLEADVEAYNKAAAAAIARFPHVKTCDLFATVERTCGKGYSACNISKPGGPHYTPQGFALLGEAVAACIKNHASPPAAPPAPAALDVPQEAAAAFLFGVNTHYHQGLPGETEMLSKAFKIVRVDFTWEGIEKTKGEYNFTVYDGLLQELKAHGVRPYWILDYGNPLYDGGLSPHSTEAVDAFAKFAVAAASHFKGQGVIWELWNEPNGGFWKPVANATAYARLATAVGRAWEANGLGSEFLIGPAADGGWVGALQPNNWMYKVFELGVLKYFDAVSVHPYRSSTPETVIKDYATLRALIKQFNNGTELPIVSGEWGYSTCVWPCEPPNFTGHVNETLQAKYLARQWLSNRLADVSISIWYDWRDGCTNTTQRECMFGTVRAPYTGDATAPFKPKPAFDAALAIQAALDKAAQVTRINASTPETAPESDPNAFVVKLENDGTSPGLVSWLVQGAQYGTCDQVPSDQHEDCGFYGISEQECEKRGCCFQDPHAPGPQCFFRLRHSSAVVSFDLGDGSSTCFTTSDYLGRPLTTKVCAKQGHVELEASDGVVYLTAEN
eukprot:m.484268 g.484268  ORF g.484268 m.484268 type:complete len:756 (-) comp23280_c0_seq1:62-2329(-)